MEKRLIKVARKIDGNVAQSFVLINDRVLPFENSDDIDVYVAAGKEHGVAVYCHGDAGGSVSVILTKSGGNVIAPLTATISHDADVGYASDRFIVE